MYNEEIKKRFISEFTTSLSRQDSAVRFFNNLEPEEEKREADICTFDLETLQPIVEQNLGTRENGFTTRLTILRHYAEWCMDNQIPGACDAALNIKDISLNKVKHSMVANPQHLKGYMDLIFDPVEDETTDCVLRAFLWMAFAGVPEDKAIYILDSDIDFDAMVIHCDGMEYPLYREGIKEFRICATRETMRFRATKNFVRITEKKRVEGHRLLRTFQADESEINMHVLVAKVSKYIHDSSDKLQQNDKYNLNLGYSRIQLSGIFYRMYEAERAGMPPDFKAVASEHLRLHPVKVTELKDKTRDQYNTKRNQLSREYMSDYERWKRAFQTE